VVSTVAAEVRSALGDSVVAAFTGSEPVLDTMCLALSSRLFMVTDPEKTVSEIRRSVFEQAGIEFDSARDDVRNLFPHTVLARRRGSCLGISLVVLLIGERLGLPLHGVLAPRHFFVRFDDGRTAINIEPLKAGEHRDSAWYRERFSIPEGSWYTLANLSGQEVEAVLRYNVANCLCQRGRADTAVKQYRRVVEALPGFAEAWGNLGIALQSLGQTEEALAAFERARELDPAMKKISANIGALFIERGDYRRAVREYEEGLRGKPHDPDLLYGLAYSWYGMREPAKAALYARKALAARGDFAEAEQLLRRAERG
jgi:tetratricopeptide (TPR) repeat protein